MGNGSCCKMVERNDTLTLEEESTSKRENKPLTNSNHVKPLSQEAQMISLSDSEGDYDGGPKKQHQFGIFKDQKKGSQLSTGQQYSFQSLPSERQFSNFVTFQALPSGQNIQTNTFNRLQQNFQAEMNEIAHFQQSGGAKSQKKVHFASTQV